jgi:hypothetical protein
MRAATTSAAPTTGAQTEVDEHVPDPHGEDSRNGNGEAYALGYSWGVPESWKYEPNSNPVLRQVRRRRSTIGQSLKRMSSLSCA